MRQSLAFTGKKKKKLHKLKVASYILFRELTEYYSWETASQIAPRYCSKEVREEPEYIEVSVENK